MDKRNYKDDLNLMQTVYAISLVLGLRNIVESLYSIFSEDKIFNDVIAVKGISSIVLILLIMRFFWALGNIRRFIFRNKGKLHKTRRYVITFHFFILLLHAFVIYFLTQYIRDIESKDLLAKTTIIITHVYFVLLLINILWLSCLIHRKQDKYPEIIWIKNNLISLIISVSFFWISYNIFKDYFSSFILCCFSLFINSIVDLFKTSSTYIGDIE